MSDHLLYIGLAAIGGAIGTALALAALYLAAAIYIHSDDTKNEEPRQ